MAERMCPCGNCRATWDQAVADLMHGPAALNRDQAEARLEAMAATPGENRARGNR